MPRSNERRVTGGASNAKVNNGVADDFEELMSQGEALQELFRLVGKIATQKLPPGVRTLAAAVQASSNVLHSPVLAAALGNEWAGSPGSVAKYLSKINRWYSLVHAGGGQAGLFDGEPAYCVGLSPRGMAFFSHLQQERTSSFSKLLQDNSPEIRQAVIAALALIYSKSSAIQELEKIAKSDSDSIIREDAKKALLLASRLDHPMSTINDNMELSFDLTNGHYNEIDFNMSDNLNKSQKNLPRLNAFTGLRSVVELLEAGKPLNDIRERIQQFIATPSDIKLSVSMTRSLNTWLRAQDPSDPKQQLSLHDKRRVVEFIELLENASQCHLTRCGERCRFDVGADESHPEGSFRVRGLGESQAKIRRVRLSSLLDDAPFEFEERKQEEGEAKKPTNWAEETMKKKTRKSQGKPR